MLEYDFTPFMERISPTPLLMTLSDYATATATDIELEYCAKVPGRKQLGCINSSYYAACNGKCNETSAAARNFFVKNLRRASSVLARGRNINAPGGR
jgi:hypothetical protein